MIFLGIDWNFWMKHHTKIKVPQFSLISVCVDLLFRPSCNRILGPANVLQIDASHASLDTTYTTTVFTTLSAIPDDNGNTVPLRVTIKAGTNNTIDFLRFLVYLVKRRALIENDFLIVDNTKIHTSSLVFRVLTIICDAADVHLRLMPYYCPEVSPAELVHGFCKETIRQNRSPSDSLWEYILGAHALVTPSMMLQFYAKCVK